MNAINTLKDTELAIAGLTVNEKKQLLKSLTRDIENGLVGVEKHPNIMGEVACIRETRIPVWMLFQAHRQGVSEGDLLKNYPGLTAEDLVNAWDYVESHKSEIENQIALNEQKD